MEDVADLFADLKSRASEEVFGYGIVDDRVAYLVKKKNSKWKDKWVRENDETVFVYQNCWGDAWQDTVRPALNNTPGAALILVMVEEEGLYFVRKRNITQGAKGRSTYTLLF